MNQKFNVICVSKHFGDNGHSFHEPITGIAELALDFGAVRDLGTIITVQFRDSKYAYDGADSGLDGSCLRLRIKVSRWESWSLYTDTPSGAGPEVTTEEIREKAKRAIERRRNKGY